MNPDCREIQGIFQRSPAACPPTQPRPDILTLTDRHLWGIPRHGTPVVVSQPCSRVLGDISHWKMGRNRKREHPKKYKEEHFGHEDKSVKGKMEKINYRGIYCGMTK